MAQKPGLQGLEPAAQIPAAGVQAVSVDPEGGYGRVSERFAELNNKGEPHPAKEYTALEMLAIAATGIVALLAPYWGTALAIAAGWLA